MPTHPEPSRGHAHAVTTEQYTHANAPQVHASLPRYSAEVEHGGWAQLLKKTEVASDGASAQLSSSSNGDPPSRPRRDCLFFARERGAWPHPVLASNARRDVPYGHPQPS